MSGWGTVTIGDKQWAVDIASTFWELSQGLGGLSELPAGTGMLFDLGSEQIIEVTTVPMLFPLDIAFLSEDLMVTEVYRGVEPGYIVTSQLPARYFLEVNAGELADVEAGSQAVVSLLATENTAAVSDWTPAMFGFIGFLMMGIFMVIIVQDFTSKVFKEPGKEPLLYGPKGEKLLTQTSAVITQKGEPHGTCYADAWRFLIKEGEGNLVHGTVYIGNRRIRHAWVETESGFVWEPQTGRYFTLLGFRCDFAPLEESRYTPEEAAIMVARTKHFGPWTEEERRLYLKDKPPSVISEHPQQPKRQDDLEFLPDSPEFLAYTIDDIGFREKIDSAFQQAILRAKGLRQ